MIAASPAADTDADRTFAYRKINPHSAYVGVSFGFKAGRLCDFVTKALSPNEKKDFIAAFNKVTGSDIKTLDEATLWAAIRGHCKRESLDELKRMVDDICREWKGSDPLKEYWGRGGLGMRGFEGLRASVQGIYDKFVEEHGYKPKLNNLFAKVVTQPEGEDDIMKCKVIARRFYAPNLKIAQLVSDMVNAISLDKAVEGGHAIGHDNIGGCYYEYHFAKPQELASMPDSEELQISESGVSFFEKSGSPRKPYKNFSSRTVAYEDVLLFHGLFNGIPEHSMRKIYVVVDERNPEKGAWEHPINTRDELVSGLEEDLAIHDPSRLTLPEQGDLVRKGGSAQGRG